MSRRGRAHVEPETRRRRKLIERADDLLRDAHCDTVSGAKEDRQYRRAKAAERKHRARLWRAKQKRLVGRFGAASPGRTISEEEIE